MVVLTKQTAQNIVDSIKSICGYDINYINDKGIIFASTSPSRIGDYHEIGKKVIETKEAIEIYEDSKFLGTKAGVNIPFFYNESLKSVIGISGNPQDVRKFADLAIRLSTIILREQEMNALDYSKKSQLNYIVNSLIENSSINQDYLFKILNELGIDPAKSFKTVLIQLNHKEKNDNVNNDISKAIREIGIKLYTFNFPSEYVLIIDDEKIESFNRLFMALEGRLKNKVKVMIGGSYSLFKQNESYETANIALKSINEDFIVSYDNLKLEIILGGLGDTVKKNFINKTIKNLNDEQIDILRIYFENDKSLVKTSEALFLHKNTLQYKLNQIKDDTGYDPREFKDSILLYLGIKLK